MALSEFSARAKEAEDKLCELEKQLNSLSNNSNKSRLDDSKEEWEVVYWGGITNRGSFVKLIFEESNIAYRCVDQKEDVTALMRSDRYGKQKRDEGGAFQSMAVPQVRKGNFMISQTGAIISYLSVLFGLAPGNLEDQALATMLCANCNDLIPEIYKVKSEGKEAIMKYVNGRFQIWMDIFEKPLQSQNSKYYFSDKCSQADLCVYALLRGCEQMFGEKAFNAFVIGNAKRPVLHAHYRRMAQRKSVKRLALHQKDDEFFPGAFGWDEMKKILREHAENSNTFASDEIIPDVIDSEPKNLLKMQYKVGDLTCDLNAMGVTLTPTQVQNAPINMSFDGVSPDKLYCVILTDPDARDRVKHEFREWVHCVRVNVNGSDLTNSGEEVIAYVGSGPPPGSGVHRYVYLVFEQSQKIDIRKCGQKVLKGKGSGGQGRRSWKARQFAKNNNLVDLVAGTYYNAEYDDYVPKLYEMLQAKKT